MVKHKHIRARRVASGVIGSGVLAVLASCAPCDCCSGPTGFELATTSPMDLSHLKLSTPEDELILGVIVEHVNTEETEETELVVIDATGGKYSVPDRSLVDAPNDCSEYQATIKFTLDVPLQWNKYQEDFMPIELQARAGGAPFTVDLWWDWQLEAESKYYTSQQLP